MKSDEELTKRILAEIAALPLDEQAKAIHALIGSAMKVMPIETIIEMREEILSQLDPSVSIVASTINLIGGHLALREIAGDENWGRES